MLATQRLRQGWLVVDGRVLVLCPHPLTHTLSELQVCVLLCAAEALCRSLKSRFFGRGEVCRRCFLLSRWVRFSLRCGLWHHTVAWRRGRRFCGWRLRVTEKRVRIGNLLCGLGFFHALLFLTLLLLLALLQLWGSLRHFKYNGGVLLQVLTPGWLSQHDDPSAVHSRRRFEIELPAVLLPALELGVMLSFHVSRRHRHLKNLQKEKSSHPVTAVLTCSFHDWPLYWDCELCLQMPNDRHTQSSRRYI